MKLKYYLRGVGIGLIFAAIVMGIALSKRGRELTDAEIMERARKLGMVEAEGTLTDYASSTGEGSDEVDKTGDDAGRSVSEEADKEGEEALGQEDKEIVLAPLVPQGRQGSYFLYLSRAAASLVFPSSFCFFSILTSLSSEGVR